MLDKKYHVDIFADGLVVNIYIIHQPEKGKIDIEYINLRLILASSILLIDMVQIYYYLSSLGLGGVIDIIIYKKSKVNNNR